MESRTPRGNPAVGAMFGRIAGIYDFLNHFLSLGIDRGWRKKLAALACEQESGLLLDLAAGTLDVALAMHATRPEAEILAVDFCTAMLARGRKKLKTGTAKKRILTCGGDAFSLPLNEGRAGAVTIAFGIRNIQPRKKAFAEMLRVLVPGGRAFILEFGSGREKIWGGLYNFYLGHVLPLIGRLLARDKAAYAYLAETVRQFPSAAALAREMEESGFENVGFRKLTSGIVCLHWGRKPPCVSGNDAKPQNAL